MGFLLEDVLYVLLCCFKVDFQGGHGVLDMGWLHIERKLDLCYSLMGWADHSEVSRVEVATMLGWTFTS